MPYLTPETIPPANVCRRLLIPDDIKIVAAVNGALLELAKEHNWEFFGAVTPEEISNAMLVMLVDFMNSECFMIGAMMPYPGADVPTGTLPCDGTSYSRFDYPDLYAYLTDTEYIVDADYFVTPTWPGRTVIMPSVADSIAPGAEIGEFEHTLTEGELAPHYHSESIVISSPGLEGEIPFLTAAGSAGVTGYAGGGESHNNVQPSKAFNWCIVSGMSRNASVVIQNLFGSATPDWNSSNSRGGINLGVLVSFAVPGQIIGVRTYSGSEEFPEDSENFHGYVWSIEGDLLATCDFPSSYYGWVNVDFDTPLAVEADTLYVVAVYGDEGSWVGQSGFFNDAPFVNGDIIALQNEAEDFEPNGRFNAGGEGLFPASGYGGTNFNVDVRFVANV